MLQKKFQRTILTIGVFIISYCCYKKKEAISNNNIIKKLASKNIKNISKGKYHEEIHDIDNLNTKETESGNKKITYISNKWFEGYDLNSFNIKNENPNIKAIIVPHAGLKFVGEEIANVLSIIDWKNIKKIIILATNHKNNQNFKLDDEITELISPLNSNEKIKTFSYEDKSILKDNDKMGQEHSWQIILPFLTKISKKYNNISICPIIVGNDDINITKLQNFITNNPNTLIIANTDLLHCGTYYNQECPKDTTEFNAKTIDSIENAILNKKTLESIREGFNTMCGYFAINTFSKLCSKLNYNDITNMSYYNSSYKENNTSNSVGYVTMAIGQNTNYSPFRENRLSSNNLGIQLEQIAKNAIKDYRKIASKSIEVYNSSKKFNGIFVTLYDSNNNLRGCIGNFETSTDLINQLKKVAVDASNDNRFEKIKPEEIDNLKIEITILGPLIEIKESDLKEVISSHKYGIKAYFGNKSATFLASAIEEYNMNSQNIIDKLKEKAGSNNNITKLEKYRCYTISEWING